MTSRSPSVARWAAAALAFVALNLLSLIFALLAGWTSTPVGARRLVESIPTLLLSLLFGLAAVAAGRGILHRRVRSPWLLLALVIPGLMALNLAGVTGG